MNAWTDVFAASRDEDCNVIVFCVFIFVFLCDILLPSGVINDEYGERQTDATWSTIDNRLSVTTPRSRAEPTTPTVDDKTGTS